MLNEIPLIKSKLKPAFIAPIIRVLNRAFKILKIIENSSLKGYQHKDVTV